MHHNVRYYLIGAIPHCCGAGDNSNATFNDGSGSGNSSLNTECIGNETRIIYCHNFAVKHSGIQTNVGVQCEPGYWIRRDCDSISNSRQV